MGIATNALAAPVNDSVSVVPTPHTEIIAHDIHAAASQLAVVVPMRDITAAGISTHIGRAVIVVPIVLGGGMVVARYGTYLEVRRFFFKSNGKQIKRSE